jgi:hypothetical protein
MPKFSPRVLKAAIEITIASIDNSAVTPRLRMKSIAVVLLKMFTAESTA